jgi:hypothetical protein
MSTATEPYRFPTLLYVDDRTGPMDSRIPVLTDREIFEEVRDDLGLTDIEQVMARPPWSFEEASARFDREAWLRRVDEETLSQRKSGKTSAGEKAAAKKGDRTKKRPTPKRPR